MVIFVTEQQTSTTMNITYPHTIENGHGEKLVFLGVAQYALGKLLNKYEHFNDAPEAVKPR